jgi:ABC-2 type transport system permease protein
MFAAMGSLVSRVEDAQTVGMPVQIPLLIGYMVIFTALGSGSANPLLKVLAYVPFTAPMDMPALMATGGAGWWQVVISMLITVAAIVVMMRLGALIFSRAILRTGKRLRLRSVLRGESSSAEDEPLAVTR